MILCPYIASYKFVINFFYNNWERFECKTFTAIDFFQCIFIFYCFFAFLQYCSLSNFLSEIGQKMNEGCKTANNLPLLIRDSANRIKAMFPIDWCVANRVMRCHRLMCCHFFICHRIHFSYISGWVNAAVMELTLVLLMKKYSNYVKLFENERK